MCCQELTELVTDYLEASLPEAMVVRLEGHVRRCAHCSTFLAQTQMTVRILRMLPDNSPPLPAPVKARLLRSFRAWSHQRPFGA